MASGDCGNRPAVLKSATSLSPRRIKSWSLKDIVNRCVRDASISATEVVLRD